MKLVKIDTEKHAEVAARFNIHALPTLILFKKGEAVRAALRCAVLRWLRGTDLGWLWALGWAGGMPGCLGLWFREGP